jgi:long-subunit acyl-CoA synthetase (AMP-forming)
MGHPLTTAYTTLGPEGLQHSLDEPSVRMVFANAALLGTLLQVVDQCPSLVWVIYDGEDTADQVRCFSLVLAIPVAYFDPMCQLAEIGTATEREACRA